MINPKTVDKIKKLILKANGTDNESEAQSFMAKANELLIKHNLSEADISEEDGLQKWKYCADFKSPWERLLATCIADANLTHVVFHWKRKSVSGVISVIGDKINCEITLHMYEVLRAKIRELCKNRADKYKEELEYKFGHMASIKEMVEAGVAQPLHEYKDSYKKGFVVGLYQMFEEEKRKRSRESARESYKKGTEVNEYELMVMSKRDELAKIAEETFKNEDMGEVNEVKFKVDEGSMTGQKDGRDHKVQSALSSSSPNQEQKLIG